MKSKTPQNRCGVFDMDPGRFALPSSGTNTDMLLYAPQARVRVDYKIEKAPFKEPFLGTRL